LLNTYPITNATLSTAQVEPTGEWYALHTKARHEKRVAAALESKGIFCFLPIHTELRQWSDRKQRVELPLFSNYVFAKSDSSRESRGAILRTDGIISFVGSGGFGTPIPEEQMDAVRAIVKDRIAFTHHPFLNVGQLVRVRGGSLDGVQGILVSKNGDQSLIISVETIQRSLALRVEGYVVEAVHR
jgi:transcription antitermination factor NusG